MSVKPVLILQHVESDGPAYLGTWLRQRGLPFELRSSAAGQDFPDSIQEHSALAILGGPMSANDPLPSLRKAEALILESVALGRPILGHCLGGQLMARALGAAVRASPAPEIGWQALQRHADEAAQDWFGPVEQHTVMHWHYESFGLPAGARWIASSAACPHQAFSLGPHLAMQFHIEIDAQKLERWMQEGDPRWDSALGVHDSVQDRATILAEARSRWSSHHALADRIYCRWIANAG